MVLCTLIFRMELQDFKACLRTAPDAPETDLYHFPFANTQS